MKITTLPMNVFVGNREACQRLGIDMQKRLHVWRADHPEYSCQQPVPSGPNDLAVNYRDGESLTTADVQIADIVGFCRGDATLLVHCAAGQTRGPTMAIIALVVRGMDPFDALPVILRACYEGYGVTANICHAPLKDIFEFYGKGILR